MHVLDAFERIQKFNPEVRLRVCSDLELDFVTESEKLKKNYLDRLLGNPNIEIGRVSRSDLLNDIFPRTSVYILPSYEEAFGFAALEAISFGVPVVCSDIFALPEIVPDGEAGVLLPFKGTVNARNIVSGYGIREFDRDLHVMISDWVFESVTRILDSKLLQENMGLAGQAHARARFSFHARNAAMLEIYGRAGQV